MCPDAALGIRWIHTQPSQPQAPLLRYKTWELMGIEQKIIYVQTGSKHFQNMKVSGTNMNPELILRSLNFPTN